jgi:hypothetical protein
LCEALEQLAGKDAAQLDDLADELTPFVMAQTGLDEAQARK